MIKLKRLASILLALTLVLSLGFTAVACAPGGEDEDPTKQKVLQSIMITTEPEKTVYAEGEKFDPYGMVVTARYSDGTREEVNDYTYSPNGNLKLTDTVVTVSWSGKNVQQDIRVNMAGTYTAAAKTEFDVDGYQLLYQIEGETPTRAAQTAWDKNYKENKEINYASGGAFLGGSGFEGNWLEYDLKNETGKEITDAAIEIRLCALNYLGENGGNTKQEIERYFDITIWGVKVDVGKINIYPGEKALGTAYSNWMRLVIEGVRLLPGSNALRVESKALTDTDGNPLTSSANPGWGIIWRTAAIDVIYVWKPVGAGEESEAIQTYNVYGLGRRTNLTVVGAAHAPVGLNYIFDIKTDSVLGSGDQVIVSYAVDPFLPAAYTAKTATGYTGATLKSNPFTQAIGTRPATQVSVSNKIAISENNYIYRITVPAAEVTGDIYISSATVKTYQTLPLEMYDKTAAGWKQIAGTADNTFNGAFEAAEAQKGDGILRNQGAYEVAKTTAGRNFHYSLMQYSGSNAYTAFRFAASRDENDKLVDNAYYSLVLKNDSTLSFEVGKDQKAASVATSDHKTAESPFVGVAVENEWNRFDIVGEYAGDKLTVQVYVNFQKWNMTQATAISGVTYENGNLVHANGYKGYIFGLHDEANKAVYRPVYTSTYVAAGAPTFTQPDKTTKVTYEAEVKNSNVSYDVASSVTAADKASGGAYLGGLSNQGASLTFTFTISAANPTVTLDLIASGMYKNDTLDMANLNNYMVVLIDGKFVNLSAVTLPQGSGATENVNWQHIAISLVTLAQGKHVVKIIPVYNPTNHAMTGAGGDFACPNIDALNLYIPQ